MHSRFKRARPPVHLPTDADADEDLIAAPRLTSTFTDEIPDSEQLAGPKVLGEAKPMRGWAYLLLWLPALADLTGTTVSFDPWPAPLKRHTCAHLSRTLHSSRRRSAYDARGGQPRTREARRRGVSPAADTAPLGGSSGPRPGASLFSVTPVTSAHVRRRRCAKVSRGLRPLFAFRVDRGRRRAA